MLKYVALLAALSATASAFVPSGPVNGLNRMTERHTAVKERGMDTAALTAGGLAPLLAPLMAKAEMLDGMTTLDLANTQVIFQLLWTFIIVTMGPIILGYLWFRSTEAGVEVSD